MWTCEAGFEWRRPKLLWSAANNDAPEDLGRYRPIETICRLWSIYQQCRGLVACHDVGDEQMIAADRTLLASADIRGREFG